MAPSQASCGAEKRGSRFLATARTTALTETAAAREEGAAHDIVVDIEMQDDAEQHEKCSVAKSSTAAKE